MTHSNPENNATTSTVSAGGVVLNRDAQVLVASQRGTSWSLPKGHVDPGESFLDAAIREIREETGVTDLHLVKELGSYSRYKIGLDPSTEDTSELKQLVFYLFTTPQMVLCPEDPDNPYAKWVSIEEVSHLLTHPKDTAWFESVSSQLLDALSL